MDGGYSIIRALGANTNVRAIPRREMYSGHSRLSVYVCVCLSVCLSVCDVSVCRRMPTLLHAPGYISRSTSLKILGVTLPTACQFLSMFITSSDRATNICTR